MVKIERVLEGEKILSIRMHNSSVLDHINVFWRPSCCDVGYDRLLKERPVAREANEEWSRLIDVGSGRCIPRWDRREVSGRCRRCCERKGIYDRRRSCGGKRLMKWCWFQGRCGFFCTTKRPGNAVVKASLSNYQGCDDDKRKRENKETEAASEDEKREHYCFAFEQKSGFLSKLRETDSKTSGWKSQECWRIGSHASFGNRCEGSGWISVISEATEDVKLNAFCGGEFGYVV